MYRIQRSVSSLGGSRRQPDARDTEGATGQRHRQRVPLPLRLPGREGAAGSVREMLTEGVEM